MDTSEAQLILHQIIAGERIIEHGGASFFLREPSGSLLYEKQIKEKQFFKDCLNDGFMSNEEEKKELKDRGLWGENDEQKLETLTKDYNKINTELHNLRFKSATKKKCELMRDVVEEEIKKLEGKKKTFFFQTAEYQSGFRANQWLLQKTLYDCHKRLVWPAWEDFEQEIDIKLINELVLECFYIGLFSDSQVRFIARNEPFRSMWRTSCKTSAALFKDSVTEYTKPQRDLCYWSMVYDNVYESSECPDESVINDDKLLNDWFNQQAAKRKANKSSNQQNQSISSNPKINSASEVFVMTETRDDAKEVYNLNDSQGKQTADQRTKEINKKGSIKEADLSDTKKALQIQMNAMQTKTIKDKR